MSPNHTNNVHKGEGEVLQVHLGTNTKDKSYEQITEEAGFKLNTQEIQEWNNLKEEIKFIIGCCIDGEISIESWEKTSDKILSLISQKLEIEYLKGKNEGMQRAIDILKS